MSYLTLIEAAQYATDKTGQTVEPAALLRAGVHGVLRLSAPFGFGAMYNATRGENEDFRAGLLTIPPAHLLEIETEGCAKIEAAQSLDGQTVYFPRKERTRDQLRAMVADLDDFITGLSGAMPKPPAPALEHVGKVGAIPGNLPRTGAGNLAVKAAWQIECETGKRASDKEVMTRLQKWANSGMEPNILTKSKPEKRAVQWLTGKSEERDYTLEACQKTLETWFKSRQ